MENKISTSFKIKSKDVERFLKKLFSAIRPCLIKVEIRPGGAIKVGSFIIEIQSSNTEEEFQKKMGIVINEFKTK
jgi:hypothetical protein